jgi:hypothetical protein
MGTGPIATTGTGPSATTLSATPGTGPSATAGTGPSATTGTDLRPPAGTDPSPAAGTDQSQTTGTDLSLMAGTDPGRVMAVAGPGWLRVPRALPPITKNAASPSAWTARPPGRQMPIGTVRRGLIRAASMPPGTGMPGPTRSMTPPGSVQSLIGAVTPPMTGQIMAAGPGQPASSPVRSGDTRLKLRWAVATSRETVTGWTGRASWLDLATTARTREPWRACGTPCGQRGRVLNYGGTTGQRRRSSVMDSGLSGRLQRGEPMMGWRQRRSVTGSGRNGRALISGPTHTETTSVGRPRTGPGSGLSERAWSRTAPAGTSIAPAATHWPVATAR